MFWKGKISVFKQFELFMKQADVSLAQIEQPGLPENLNPGKCTVSVSKLKDVDGIAKLLNEWFEDPSSKTKANVTPQWIRQTFLDNHSIWIVAKDVNGTIRGCVSSFIINPPYPNSLTGCGKPHPWGIVDWYCVHPLWRSKGLGSTLLEVLDFVTYRVGRKAHVFLKEGMPLSLPHIPIYTTWLKCRRAGNPNVKQMSEYTGLSVYPYQEVERATGIPMVRIEGLSNERDVAEWEDALDRELPECWVFVSGDCLVKNEKGWQTDSLVSMYAFRWSPGKWLGSRPDTSIL
jgi:GNAT superfamily N-acetyltransferase|uniref:N-acetyltransferase domain-containing protein n=1 Tax=viral metagenome TaxID=1070528 RepID=A0A6C0DK69_9ZZZZ